MSSGRAARRFLSGTSCRGVARRRPRWHLDEILHCIRTRPRRARHGAERTRGEAREVQRAGGWKDPAMVARYAVAGSSRDVAVNRLMRRSVGGKSDGQG